MSHTVLITGPVQGLERYSESARGAKWKTVDFPLLEIRAHADALDAELDGPPFDWICVTSQNALPALTRAADALTPVPCAVVGERTAEELAARGFRVAIGPAPNASLLADALAPSIDSGTRVLWPRGSLASELGKRLSDLGAQVHAPVVYATIPLPLEKEPPRVDAVFFASPSAVWRFAEVSDRRDFEAIAIGPTTLDALRAVEDDSGRAFRAVLGLIETSPAALRSTLETLRKSK